MQKLILFRNSLFRHFMVSVLAIVLMGFFALIAVTFKPLNPIKRALENFSFADIYYEILKETADADTSRVITIVDLTKQTNRADIAQTLRDIEAANPKVVGVDCCFDNIGEDLAANEEIISVAEEYSNIVWSLKLLNHSGDESIGWTKAIHSFFGEFVNIQEGTTNMPRALYDSMKRTMPMTERFDGEDLFSFVTLVSNNYAGKDISQGRKGDIDINFSPIVFRVLQPEDVATHHDWLEDQIVLYGAMYEDIDTHWTPVGKIAGVELLAYSIQTMIYGKEIKTVHPALFWPISFIIILFVQMWQAWYIYRTQRSEKMFVRFLIGSSYIMNIQLALISITLVGISFLVFKLYNVSFNIAWVLSAVAFLSTSRLMYDSIKDYIMALAQKQIKE